jgi:phosphoribosylanthranilate isomerase
VFVKICGITSEAAVEAAIEAGADALGFVFAPSVREVSPERARALCVGVPAGVARVAVLRHPAAEHWRRVLDVFAPDCLQTDAADFAAIDLPADCRPLPVYRTSVRAAASELPARLLFEGAVSGSGRTADWQEAAELAAVAELVLAGGLHVDNVAAAIEQVKPWGVDVSSGVERERGVKDPRRIREFVARVRACEESR